MIETSALPTAMNTPINICGGPKTRANRIITLSTATRNKSDGHADALQLAPRPTADGQSLQEQEEYRSPNVGHITLPKPARKATAGKHKKIGQSHHDGALCPCSPPQTEVLSVVQRDDAVMDYQALDSYIR